MSSSGSQKTISQPVIDFIKLIASKEIVNLKYTDLDGVEHEFGMRNTREFIDYFISLNMLLASKHAVPPSGGFKA